MKSDDIPALIGMVFPSGLQSGDFRKSVASMGFCNEVYIPVVSIEDREVPDIVASGAKPLIVEKVSAYQCLEALKNSGTKWVLIVDDRETCSTQLEVAIPSLIATKSTSAYRISRSQSFNGVSIDSIMDDATSVALANLELVQILPEMSLHRIFSSESATKIEEKIERIVFKDFSDCVRWMDFESDDQAIIAKQQGKKYCVFGSLFKGIGLFIHCYFFKGGRKLGMPGLFLCVNLGMLKFLTAIKHREAILGTAKVPV